VGQAYQKRHETEEETVKLFAYRQPRCLDDIPDDDDERAERDEPVEDDRETEAEIEWEMRE
jgi:hypothetical protein